MRIITAIILFSVLFAAFAVAINYAQRKADESQFQSGVTFGALAVREFLTAQRTDFTWDEIHARADALRELNERRPLQ